MVKRKSTWNAGKAAKKVRPAVRRDPGGSVIPRPFARSRGWVDSRKLIRFKVARWVSKTSMTGSTASSVQNQYSFLLSDLPNYTEFTNLFDSYRFLGVEMVFQPVANMGTIASNIAPTDIWSVVDLDGTPALGITGVQQYNTAELHNCYKPFTVKLVPKPTIGMYDGTPIAPGGEAPDGLWLDCADPNITHYGVMTAMPQYVSSTAQVFNVYARYSIEFKASR